MSRARVVFFALSFVGLVVACSGGDDDAATPATGSDAGGSADGTVPTGTPTDAASDAPAYNTVSDACDALAAAEVAFSVECNGFSTDPAPFALTCRNEAAAPGSGQTIATVLACAASYTARTSCKYVIDPSCTPTGTTANGGGCSYDTQCAEGACARSTDIAACGTCATSGAVGEDCTYKSCATPLQCLGNGADRKCRQPAAVGAACNKTDTPCATGATCVQGTCTVYSGVGPTPIDVTGNYAACAVGADVIGYGPRRCVLPAQEGATCDISNVMAATYQTCATGLYCAVAPTDSGTTAGTCRKPGALGEACEHQVFGGYLPKLKPLPPACAAGTMCTATGTTSGTCIAPIALGAPCLNGTCGDHEHCSNDPPNQLKPICVPAGTAGNACIYFLKCDPGLACDDSTLAGTCRPLPAIGSKCIQSQCVAGAACDSSTNTCLALAHAGESCAKATCTPDAYCDISAPGGALCITLPAIGDACDSPTDYRTCPTGSYCQHADGGTVGACAALPKLGETCGYSLKNQISRTCADGVQCIPADDAGLAYRCAYACGP